MRKNKLAEALRTKNVFNNWDLLKRFSKPGDVVVDYSPSPPGRMGIGCPDHTLIWSIRKEPKLDKPEGFMVSRGSEKVFYGNRAASLNEALTWARDTFGYGFATSPFGGYIPSHLKEKAQAFDNEKERTPQ